MFGVRLIKKGWVRRFSDMIFDVLAKIRAVLSTYNIRVIFSDFLRDQSHRKSILDHAGDQPNLWCCRDLSLLRDTIENETLFIETK
jgi:hypothetical protein